MEISSSKLKKVHIMQNALPAVVGYKVHDLPFCKSIA